MSDNLENITKKLGFGLMRLPTKGPLIDNGELCKMVDAFMQAGFNYFDTAHGYMALRSEGAIRKALVKRYPRESFFLTDKLSTQFFKTEKQIRTLFERQLKNCGVDYFDFYLMHAQSAEIFAKFKKCKAYETAFELKKEGKVRHVGISFHDKADILEQILTEYPQVEVVQIQLNYLDYEDASVEGRKCYEVCRRYNKPVIIMEPVKGGSLVNLPDEAQKILDEIGSGSNASYAIRYAAGFEGVLTVLSGMSNMEMMKDNIGYMKDFEPLNEKEREAVDRVCEIFRSLNLIQCTGCRYCLDVCPKNIPIPDLFACLNAKKQFKNWNSDYYYKNVHTANGVKPSDCIKCGKCEALCPQHLEIRKYLEEVSKEF